MPERKRFFPLRPSPSGMWLLVIRFPWSALSLGERSHWCGGLSCCCSGCKRSGGGAVFTYYIKKQTIFFILHLHMPLIDDQCVNRLKYIILPPCSHFSQGLIIDHPGACKCWHIPRSKTCHGIRTGQKMVDAEERRTWCLPGSTFNNILTSDTLAFL